MSLASIRRAPLPASTSVVDDLLACHGRIRHFVAVAERISVAHGVSSEDLAEAAAAVARYFAVALPLHAADEDLSLRPRLEAARPPRQVRDALARMSAEHDDIHRLLAEVIPRWRDVALRPVLLEESRRDLALAAADLRHHFEPHLHAEETILFPALGTLHPTSLAELRAELRARREAPAIDASAARP